MGRRNLRIKRALEEKGVSQEKLASKLGISSQAVNERLNKERDVDSVDFLIAVADLTNATMNWLIYGEVNLPSLGKYRLETVNEPESKYNPVKDELIEAQRALIKCMAEKEQVVKELEELKKFGPTGREQELTPVKK